MTDRRTEALRTKIEAAECELVSVVRFGTSELGRVAVEINGRPYEFPDVLQAKDFADRLLTAAWMIEQRALKEKT